MNGPDSEDYLFLGGEKRPDLLFSNALHQAARHYTIERSVFKTNGILDALLIYWP